VTYATRSSAAALWRRENAAVLAAATRGRMCRKQSLMSPPQRQTHRLLEAAMRPRVGGGRYTVWVGPLAHSLVIPSSFGCVTRRLLDIMLLLS